MTEPDPQGFASNSWEGDCTHDRAGSVMEQKGSLVSHLVHKSDTPNKNHISYQEDNGQHTLRKDLACVLPNEALMPKPLDTYSLHRDVVYKANTNRHKGEIDINTVIVRD